MGVDRIEISAKGKSFNFLRRVTLRVSQCPPLFQAEIQCLAWLPICVQGLFDERPHSLSCGFELQAELRV